MSSAESTTETTPTTETIATDPTPTPAAATVATTALFVPTAAAAPAAPEPQFSPKVKVDGGTVVVSNLHHHHITVRVGKATGGLNSYNPGGYDTLTFTAPSHGERLALAGVLEAAAAELRGLAITKA